MDKNVSKYYLSYIIILGAIWGLAEAALGMGLRSCASLFSGSIMTGVALFFLASSWYLTQNILSITFLVILTSLIKMFDALLLSLPLQHGAVANPIFAFFMEGIAFLFLIYIFNEKLKHKSGGQALLGGMAALLAVNLFPLVKYATGIPACVVAGTSYPLSLYYSPIAVAISMLTVPAGAWAAKKIKTAEVKFKPHPALNRIRYLASPLTLILSLIIIALLRLG
ncbi:MAG: hypothetical protein ACE5GI_03785 [Candidatus Aminicenantales bacterium]